MKAVEEGIGALVRLVLSGELPAGKNVKPDRLQAVLGVDKVIATDVRHHAIAMGLMEGNHGAGTRILPKERWNYRNPELVRQLLEHDYEVTIRRLGAVREAIEPIAASRAAKGSKETAREIAVLAERLDVLGAVPPAEFARNRDAFGEADVDFHARILRASDNPFFEADATNIELALQARLRRCAPEGHARAIGTASYYPEQPAEVALMMHIGLGKALCQGRAGAAEAMARGIVSEFLRDPDEKDNDLRARLKVASEQIVWGDYANRIRPEWWS